MLRHFLRAGRLGTAYADRSGGSPQLVRARFRTSAVGTVHIAPPGCQALRTVPTALHGFIKTRGEGNLFDRRKFAQTHRDAVSLADQVWCDFNIEHPARLSSNFPSVIAEPSLLKTRYEPPPCAPGDSPCAVCVGVRESYCLPPIARRNKLCVIVFTRSSGPWGRDQCDQGSVWPGGEDRAWAQKIVEALNTKLPLGPG